MSISNATDFDRLMEVAKEQGALAGKGRDTQVKFLMSVVEGAFHNAIDLTPSKHGTDIDDATKLTEAYVMAQRGATIFDAKSPNQRKAISCVRTCTKLGQWTKGGNGEPLQSMNNLINMRQKLRADPLIAKKLDDAANTLLKFARTQIKRDTLIDDSELRSFCFRPDAALKTPEQIISSMRDQLTKLINGEASSRTAQDRSPKVRAARDALTERLKEIATARGKVNGPHAAAATP